MQDIDMLVGGYVIVFVYVLVMLGRWDCVEQKVYLSMGGILGVMMGIVVSVTIIIIITTNFIPRSATACAPPWASSTPRPTP